MRQRLTDIAIVTSLAAIALLLSVSHLGVGSWGAFVTFPLVVVLPGYALAAALFPAPASITVPARIMLSLGLSVFIVILSGIALNMLPIGLTPTSWQALLGAFTFVGASIAAYRRRRYLALPESPGSTTSRWHFNFRSLFQALLLIAALGMTLFAIGFAQYSAQTQPRPGFTELWLLQTAQKAPQTLRLGVKSDEHTQQQYRLTVSIDAKLVSSTAFTLDPGQTWERVMSLPANNEHPRVEIVANLYRAGFPQTAYRTVHVWVQT